MKREEIENRDQELVKKFRTIIQNKEKRSANRSYHIGLFFLLAVLIVSSIVFLVRQQVISPPKVPETLPQAQTVPMPENKPASIIGNAETETKIISNIKKEPDPPRKIVDEKTVQKSSDPVLNNPVPEKNDSVEFPIQRVKDIIPSRIRIKEIISCSSVQDRQYSQPKVEFSLAKDTKLMVWMEVISKDPPFTLTHVYYLNGKKYCAVPLAIRYHRMRTWSSVTVQSPDHIGKWRVNVINDSGDILDHIEFSVVK